MGIQPQRVALAGAWWRAEAACELTAAWPLAEFAGRYPVKFEHVPGNEQPAGVVVDTGVGRAGAGRG